ncbi:MAG: nitrous oxide reductase, partial [Hydrogenobacter sp.]
MLGKKKFFVGGLTALAVGALLAGCPPKQEAVKTAAVGADVASKVYVPPGKHDEFYVFFSGGFSGQVSVYGIPSGRIIK